jgi:aquaporin Z
MIAALRHHWPEYLAEAGGLGAVMLVSSLIVAAAEVPLIPTLGALAPLGRCSVEAMVIAGTVVAMIYSPWGRQSGAHFNPAVTLVFLLLGRVRPWDAAFYVLAQIGGGLLGLVLASLLLGQVVGLPPVMWITTVPGPAGSGPAFLAEFMSAFLLMSVVLTFGGLPRFAAFTGLAAGCLVFIYIVFESPISGFSLNPARSLASALPSGVWTAFWIYLFAPPLGMLFAALVNQEAQLPSLSCAKLQHDRSVRCIHCGFEPRQMPDTSLQQGENPCRTTATT